jgi:large subunit ribosomal protein L25
MRKDITIGAEPRNERGKNEARRLRVAGRIPAVVYGAGKDAAAISLDPREVDRILYSGTGHNTIFNVSVGGQDAAPVMIVDWQHDPVKDNLLHVDLEWIDLSKKLTVKVPIHTEGEPIGVKQQGGLLEPVHREVEVECLPDDIPEAITVSVEHLSMGENLRAKELPLPERIELLSSPELVICHIIAIRGSDTETAEAEEGEAEGAEAEAGAETPEAESKG